MKSEGLSNKALLYKVTGGTDYHTADLDATCLFVGLGKDGHWVMQFIGYQQEILPEHLQEIYYGTGS